jgi:hypothetical protein
MDPNETAETEQKRTMHIKGSWAEVVEVPMVRSTDTDADLRRSRFCVFPGLSDLIKNIELLAISSQNVRR